MKVLHSIASETKRLQALFGQDETKCTCTENGIDLYLNLPSFGEENAECLLSQPGRIYQKLDFNVIETADRLAGAIVKEASFPLEQTAYEIYLNFLQVTRGWNLFRIWNYVPYINEETWGLENYKSFCKGRSLAFERFYGQNFTVKLPAASAVGINDDKLVLYFIAGKEPGIYMENPEQVSAFFYPKRYGPRSPSFARGTLIYKPGKQIAYLSGTASIKSYESVTLGAVSEQLHTTLDNMSLVFERMGLVEERMSFSGIMPDPAKYARHFKVYIRHETDFSCIKELFSASIFAAKEDRTIYLKSDICRPELDIEIEAYIENNICLESENFIFTTLS